MNRYMMIRRLSGPAFLLLTGVLALLNQAGILSWGKSWPFYLILAGVLNLARRAALASDGGYPPQTPFTGPAYQGQPYSGQPFPGQPFPGQPRQGQPYPAGAPQQQPPAPSTSIVPSESNDNEGGQR
jgi:hypothetical protein